MVRRISQRVTFEVGRTMVPNYGFDNLTNLSNGTGWPHIQPPLDGLAASSAFRLLSASGGADTSSEISE